MSCKKSISLSQLAKLLDAELLLGSELSESEDLIVSSVVESSKHDKPGSVFVAYKGVTVDGHDFINEAVENGSSAIVVSDKSKLGPHPGLLVKDGRQAISKLSAYFCDDPSRDLLCVGITGTNGKTTINWLLYNMLERLDMTGISIGTLGTHAKGHIDRTSQYTTPSAIEIQHSLHVAKSKGLKSCVIETSSHALAQHRVDDLYFDLGIFTNLSTDHLDFHKDMESYFKAKVKLFNMLADNKSDLLAQAVVNSDCAYGRRLMAHLERLDLAYLSFGSNTKSDIRIKEWQHDLRANKVSLVCANQEFTIHSPLIGAHNASNLAACFAAGVALGFAPGEVEEVMKDLPCVPGRLEYFGSEKIAVYVDYAHTGDGLHHALSSLRELAKEDLWVVFGCGGNKDHRKRRGMGAAAAKLADKIVITSDNPKTEDPQKIIDEILRACEATFVEPDRALALEMTLREAKEGDVVLIAGKGHEDYQIIGTEVFHFSDREEVLKLRERGVF